MPTNGGYYNRGLERPVEREDITGGSKYNTTYEGYNWGAGAKYKLSKRNVSSSTIQETITHHATNT